MLCRQKRKAHITFLASGNVPMLQVAGQCWWDKVGQGSWGLESEGEAGPCPWGLTQSSPSAEGLLSGSGRVELQGDAPS